MNVINIAIIGGTGYTGVELLRLLAQHPKARVQAISSRAEAGRPVADLYPNLRGHYDLKFSHPDEGDFGRIDIVFFATPHGVAQSTVKSVLDKGARVIDLSADFRIRDIETWETWYAQDHQCPELVPEAVYGLPEVNRDEIKSAKLLACPGCYPTSIQLGLKPLLEIGGLINTQTIVANSASGATGAGRQANVDTLFTEVGDSFKPYAVGGHRHLPEIEQGLSDIAQSNVSLTFVPHLLPVNRGILSTIYVDLLDHSPTDFQALYEKAFENEYFVDVLPAGCQPSLRSVRGTNFCRISVVRPQGRDKLVITAVEDNLTKGASGQAIQNMNIMCGLDEYLGLNLVALMP